MNYLALALGLKKWMVLSDTLLHLTHLGLIYLGLQWFGVLGAAIAFCTLYLLHVLAMQLLARRLTGFRFSHSVRRLVLVAIPTTVAVFLASQTLPTTWMTVVGVPVTAAVCWYSLIEIAGRVGTDHPVIQLTHRLPVLGTLIQRRLKG